MPELPEVVTVCKILNQDVKDLTIENFMIFYGNLLKTPNIEEFKNRVKNQKILKVFNIAKYIIFELENDVIISHLRMEGRWAVENPEYYSYGKNLLEAQFSLNNGKMLRYYDSRRFGTLELISKNEYLLVPPISKLGLTPLDKKMTGEVLFEKFKKIKRPIKSVLLEQNIISGIGNIYDNEILFAAKINPLTKANELSLEQCQKIIELSAKILSKAIEMGGTTIHSFAPKFGVTGGYQNMLQVHGRNNKKCYVCQSKIEKIMVNGRGTFFCPNCQKK